MLLSMYVSLWFLVVSTADVCVQLSMNRIVRMESPYLLHLLLHHNPLGRRGYHDDALRGRLEHRGAGATRREGV